MLAWIGVGGVCSGPTHRDGACDEWGTWKFCGAWAGDLVGRGLKQGYFVGEDELGDGEVMLLRNREKLGGAREWVGDGAGGDLALFWVGGELGGGEDEAAAYGVEGALGEDFACGVEGGEAHAVGVRGGGFRVRGVHLGAVEVEVGLLVEGDGAGAGQGEGLGGSDLLDDGFDVGGFDGVWGLAGEAEEDGAVSGVADAGVGERAVELGLDAGDGGEIRELAYEAEGGAHGADSVRGGGADADFEEFEEACVHWWSAVIVGRIGAGAIVR